MKDDPIWRVPRSSIKRRRFVARLLPFHKRDSLQTSTDDLMEAMDIGRQSMYDTFGDKRALFLKALEVYSRENTAAIVAELQRLAPLLLMSIMLSCSLQRGETFQVLMDAWGSTRSASLGYKMERSCGSGAVQHWNCGERW